MDIQKLILQLPWTELPPRYTCDGGDISPPLRIEGLLGEVHSLAVMVYHPHETGCCSFCAWIIWNVPPLGFIREGIPPGNEVTSPIQGSQGRNDYGKIGYSGPCPSAGTSHRVNYKIYGLDTHLSLPGGSNQHALIQAMRGHVLQFGETFAMYTR
ncbi:MAG: YbhB/YbcL family Raf kinase inhibitor-like protein [Methanomicrobiales archaeon]|nr:YbhB/YbcL family Raf kinase inhibitor-like protein [Methanomicrobiales archaeon]